MLSQSRVIRGNVVFFCRSCTSSTRRQLCRPQLYCCKCVGAFVANRTFPCLLASAKARAVPGHLCSSPCHPGVRMVCPPLADAALQPFAGNNRWSVITNKEEQETHPEQTAKKQEHTCSHPKTQRKATKRNPNITEDHPHATQQRRGHTNLAQQPALLRRRTRIFNAV